MRVAAHFGTTIAGRFLTSWRVISHEMPPAPTTIAARSTVTGTPDSPSSRSTSRRERRCGGQVVGVLAEPAEEDDLADAARGGRQPEGARGVGVLLLEVVVVERVHEVDGHVDARRAARRGSRGR